MNEPRPDGDGAVPLTSPSPRAAAGPPAQRTDVGRGGLAQATRLACWQLERDARPCARPVPGATGNGVLADASAPPQHPGRLRPALALLLLVATASCAPGPSLPPPPVAFDVARTWIITGADSVPITVELATTLEQAERGLMDRASLERDSGMLFLFGEPRGADDGFWMWRTRIPLDLAVLDGEGHVVALMEMEPCLEARAEDCPPHIPGAAHSAALEVNRGWFEQNGVGIGSRVEVPGR